MPLYEEALKHIAEKSYDEAFNIAHQYEIGDDALGIPQDFKKAAELYHALANKKYNAAIVKMGYFFENGLGTRKNLQSAYWFYNRAAENNDPEGIYRLAMMILYQKEQKNYEENAIVLLKKSSEKGYVRANYILGCIYEHGITKDFYMAANYYVQALNQGWLHGSKHLNNFKNKFENKEFHEDCVITPTIAGANNLLGIAMQHYYKGEYSQAFYLLLDSSNYGNSDASYHLANMYLYGQGVKENKKKAIELLRVAVNRNNHKAQNSLAVLIQENQVEGISAASANKLFSKSARQGNVTALLNKGMLALNNGLYREAREYFEGVLAREDASAASIARANNMLGSIYEYGYSVVVNLEKAKTYYCQALKLGVEEAETHLHRVKEKLKKNNDDTQSNLSVHIQDDILYLTEIIKNRIFVDNHTEITVNIKCENSSALPKNIIVNVNRVLDIYLKMFKERNESLFECVLNIERYGLLKLIKFISAEKVFLETDKKEFEDSSHGNTTLAVFMQQMSKNILDRRTAFLDKLFDRTMPLLSPIEKTFYDSNCRGVMFGVRLNFQSLINTLSSLSSEIHSLSIVEERKFVNEAITLYKLAAARLAQKSAEQQDTFFLSATYLDIQQIVHQAERRLEHLRNRHQEEKLQKEIFLLKLKNEQSPDISITREQDITSRQNALHEFREKVRLESSKRMTLEKLRRAKLLAITKKVAAHSNETELKHQQEQFNEAVEKILNLKDRDVLILKFILANNPKYIRSCDFNNFMTHLGAVHETQSGNNGHKFTINLIHQKHPFIYGYHTPHGRDDRMKDVSLVKNFFENIGITKDNLESLIMRYKRSAPRERKGNRHAY